MAKNIVGTFIMVIMILVGFLVLSNYNIAQYDYAASQEQLFNEVQQFLDKVADTKVITDRDLEDFTLAMASTSIPAKFEILREARQVNPDPASTVIPRATYTTWVPTEDIRNYDDGDFIIIRVSQIGDNFYQSFSRRALNMYTPRIDFTLSRQVR